MRFFRDGPSIPDLLLERRDQGRVVFLCGAGVSLPAGMPTFLELTEYVVEFFDPPETSVLAISFQPWKEGFKGPKIPLDQIFHLLYQEYGREDVNALVVERLRSENKCKRQSPAHRIIARISSNQEGSPQIVTTNFDLLFEETSEVIQGGIYEPPAFPDISLGIPLTGVTYLHGRLNELGDNQHSYVLSSADFGRAYLSEGWATNFIRSLLESYTVVLVGYQAEDPPVKYLLQGLNHDGMSDRSKLYAFDKGNPEEIEAKWRDRGVTAIAYKDHSHLWESLEAWADRADDPRKWRSKVIELAMQSPRQIAAFERGQVAHLVRTTPGARLFASANPSPPAEWLCVFDASCRVAKKSSGYGDNPEFFDPFEVYGLDDDPPPPTKIGQKIQRVHDNIFEWRRGDTNPTTFHKIGGRQVSGFEDMPSRLFYLTHWIAKNLDSPITAWWALRQNGLHPRLTYVINNELRQKSQLDQSARRTWSLVLEHQSDVRSFSTGSEWFEFQDKIRKEGWNSSALRDFEETTKPILTYSLPLGVGASKPPLGTWDETSSQELGTFDVEYPDRHGEIIEIPDDFVEPVFTTIERHFHRAAGLLRELEVNFFRTPTCYPHRDIVGEARESDATFVWFLELFSRLVELFPVKARAYSIIWPAEDEYYFRKLKLFALNLTRLFIADEAAEIILDLNQEEFWGTSIRRELLFLIQDRWEEFSEVSRIMLIDRLLDGPGRMEHWSEEEYLGLQAGIACRYTKWLTIQGRVLSPIQTARLEKMISGLSDWNDAYAASLATEHYGHSGWVGTDETPDTIINLPISEIVEQVMTEPERDFDSLTEKRPFTGLVKSDPRRALASLSFVSKKGNYPRKLWSVLIHEWPEETGHRLFSVFLRRLMGLPHRAIRELRHAIGEWIEKKFLVAYMFDRVLAWKAFDHLVSGLLSEDGAAIESAVGEIRRAGDSVQHSRRTIEYAISGPLGNTAKGLINVLDSLKLGEGYGVPGEFKVRFERLLSAPGEGGDHTVSILTQQISWLYYIDPEWVMTRLVPWFDFENSTSEPAWNGYLSAARIFPRSVGTALKPLVLKLFPNIYRWSWDRGLAKIAAEIIVELAVMADDKSFGLTAKEARDCLREMNDENRQDAIFQLSIIGQREENGWSTHVIPFVNTVWPRERALRTSSSVLSWVSLLLGTNSCFPAVLNSVRRFLVPIEGESHWVYRFSRDVGGRQPLTVEHPGAVLELLDSVIPNNSENIPDGLSQVLDIIGEANLKLVRDYRFLRLINLIEQR